jgi:two-component system phosphate regulon sensor histidine kinase PhoR
MDANGYEWITLVVVEIVQLLLFWAFVRRRYQLPLRRLGRMTGELVAGNRPVSFYVDGPAEVTGLAQGLEELGTRLETLQRRQQEEEFNLGVLLANMVEGVMVVDQRHVVRLVNDELLNLFGLKSSPLNRTVLESLRESRVEMIVRETLARGEPQRQEVVLQSTTDTPRHFEVSAVPIRTKKGGIGGAVFVFHEITRIKQLEVMRSEFVANVSHELRTPLAIFRGFLETLMEHPELPPDEVKRVLLAMRRHSERLNALVEDLLVLTRLEAKRVEMEFSLVRLDAFFCQLIEDWRQRKNPGEVTITRHVAPDLPVLEVDPLRFEQVILNLLENAVAYSQPPREITLSAAQQDGQVEVRVSDNGMGIPAADLPHIFERFYRVDKGRGRVSGGTGLGLSIVKQMMQSHHGTVTVESELGKGTTIVLRLPVSQG